MKPSWSLITLILALGAASAALAAGWPSNVTPVAIQKGKTVTVAGKLETGQVLPDLSWASRSSVACFPATQNLRFNGKHVLYATQLPPRSILTVKVVPDDPSVDLSIYAYSIGVNNFAVVPDLGSCVSCEAEHKWDRPKRGKTQDHTRAVKLNAVTNPYNVVVGVAGANGRNTGSYTLEFTLE
ncbi:MAG: hypothetical protein KA419_13535 [Acidobacteria bacterium]|nr:hypothetical protein [Acidobacteriota bacterium]